MKIVPANITPRGKNQRILALMKVGDEVVCENRTKANSMCETAAAMGIKVGTNKREGGKVAVYVKGFLT